MTQREQTQAPAVGGEAASRVAVARNAVWLVLGQVTTTALGIVLSAALGRSLGAIQFGVYFLIVTMSGFAYVVVEWGQPLLVIREVARHPDQAGRLLGTALALRTAGALAVAAPTGLAAWALGYDARTCWLAVLMVGATIPLFLAQAYGMIFRARDRMNLDAAVSVSNKVLALGATLAALALGWGIPGVLGAQALSGAAALLVAARLYRRTGAEPLEPSKETARALLVEGLPILFMMLAVSVQPYVDAVVLSKLVPADAVGWYGAAKGIMGTLLAPSMILAAAIYPRLSRVSGNVPVFKREMRSALRPMLWLGALAGVGTWLFADVAIGLVYGARGFGPAGTILRVFGPALFLLFVDVLFGHVITATGKATGFAIAKVASVVAGTALELWLIPLFQARMGNGGVGVVVSFAASEVVVFAGSLLLMPRGSLDPGVALDLGRALLAAVATGTLFHALPAMHAAAAIPLCIAVYTLATMLLGLASRSDLALLRAVLRKGG